MGVFQNNLLAGAAAAASAGGAGFYSHQIEQSLFIPGGGTNGLNRTLGTPTNEYKVTLSCWIKRTTLGNTNIQEIFKVKDSYVNGFLNLTNAIDRLLEFGYSYEEAKEYLNKEITI
jgi:hypothetical protein